MLDIKTIKTIIDSYLSYSSLNKKCVISTNPTQLSSDKIALIAKSVLQNGDFSISQYSVLLSKEDAMNLEIIMDLYSTLKEFIEASPGKGNLISLDLVHLEIKIQIFEEKLETKSGIFLDGAEVIPCFPLLKHSFEMIAPPVRRLMSGEIDCQKIDTEEIKFRLTIEIGEHVPDVSRIAGKVLTVRLPNRFCINANIKDSYENQKQKYNTKDIYNEKFSTYTLELKMITIGFYCDSDISTKSCCKWILEEK
jgi:hypothetical protein